VSGEGSYAVILGDGVNIAARLQEISEPGGVAISSRVHDDVRDRLDANFADTGEQNLKNIARPIRVWQWSPVRAAAPANQFGSNRAVVKTSVAVLPFNDLSNDPENEAFADGLTEDIITALSHARQYNVTARNSTFAYKGRPPDVRDVAKQLDVRYALALAYILDWMFWSDSKRDVITEARKHAAKSRELAPDSAQTYRVASLLALA
jgi:adenylate cyclase